MSNSSNLITDLAYATLMCRMHYMRQREALPAATDASGMAAYHKDHYNTAKGKTDINQSIIIFKQVITSLGA